MNHTIVVRHKKENKKKCSLKGLEIRDDICFYTYPMIVLPKLDHCILLTLDSPELSISDKHRYLLLIDGTWRYAAIMEERVVNEVHIDKRSIPKGFVTAYPRKQTLCSNPKAGLASVEALYIAFKIVGRDTRGLLDNYYWKDAFLSLNRKLLNSID